MNSILYSQEGAVARITLNRPSVFNSFNREMALALQKALQEAADDATVRAVYLTGEGKAFCAGQDLQEVTGEDPPSFSTILSEHYNPIIELIREIEIPVVCAVNGVAAGAGANIALACDITVAKASATFIQAFSKIGLIPDSGGTFFLPRLIGMQKATALMMLGEKVSAADAEAMGMIYKVFSEEAFEKESWKLAEQLSQMPTVGLGLTKRALNRSLESTLHKQLAIEEELQSLAGLTKDYQEGVAAFLEKRAPEFKGM
ncbi:MAG: enoyl-CoA hydratase/isomerase family protein [Lewinellaceae bacterium]|nr:enoyl-CoA hydratase/isomerase family protein [Lewinellaceae bacterium]